MQLQSTLTCPECGHQATETMNPIYASRRRNDIIIRALCVGAALFGVTWLALILFTLFYNGLAGLSLQLFTENTPPPGSTEGGLLNAITGSIIMFPFVRAGQSVNGAAMPNSKIPADRIP